MGLHCFLLQSGPSPNIFLGTLKKKNSQAYLLCLARGIKNIYLYCCFLKAVYGGGNSPFPDLLLRGRLLNAIWVKQQWDRGKPPLYSFPCDLRKGHFIVKTNKHWNIWLCYYWEWKGFSDFIYSLFSFDLVVYSLWFKIPSI